MEPVIVFPIHWDNIFHLIYDLGGRLGRLAGWTDSSSNIGLMFSFFSGAPNNT